MVKIMRKILLLLALFAMLLLLSCESTSGPRFKGEVYSLAALLVAGQPLNEEHPVYLTRSSEIEDFNYLQIFVTDAKITLRDLTSGQEFTLQPGMAGILPAYLDPEQRLIEAEHRYRIEARIPGYQPVIWAETTVPQAITLETDVYGNNADGEGYSFDEQTQNQMPFNRIDSDFPWCSTPDRSPETIISSANSIVWKSLAQIWNIPPRSWVWYIRMLLWKRRTTQAEKPSAGSAWPAGSAQSLSKACQTTTSC